MDLPSTEDVDARDYQSASPGGSDNDNDIDPDGDNSMTDLSHPSANKNGNGKPAASNAKDPNRPRRKKARRACFACQRAHLTCGDERPCQRCIKRGLADACQDGVRKKAKYLHDAPNEALLPGAASHYTQGDLKRSGSTASQHNENISQTQQQFFQNTQPFPMFNTPMQQMPPPNLHERAPSFSQQSSSGFSMSQMQSPTSIRQHAQSVSMPGGGWNDAFLGSEDPSMFNFDIASMNFGNHYGALEFGILGKMATGAGDTPESESATQRGSVSQYALPYGSMSESPVVGYGENMMDWSNGGPRYNHMRSYREPNAFAIESSMHLTSPEATGNTPDTPAYERSPMMNMSLQPKATQQQHHHHPSMSLTGQQGISFLPLTSNDKGGGNTTNNNNNNINSNNNNNNKIPTSAPNQAPIPTISTPQLKARSQLPTKPVTGKRPRDPSSVYTSVTSPYPYTTGFHSLIAYLQRRFAASPSKTLAIAKSLASIRPSFIATTKTLNREDLIFMEKCFQRTLWEYEGFIESVGTPTIVARRTGEIAAVGKEFQILTGWSKSVLLGREPNLNVNTGHSGTTPAEGGSGSNTRGRGTGMNTPARRPITDENNGPDASGRHQPVFLAEILDDDSVVQFYEDFARLAFGDSRGSVMAKGKLLKYRTKDDEIAANLAKAEREVKAEANTTVAPRHEKSFSSSSGSPELSRIRTEMQRMDSFALARPQDAKKGISGEKGMQKLGSTDGRVDCAYCWTVKRDVFDIPMLIVINVSTHLLRRGNWGLWVWGIDANVCVAVSAMYMMAATTHSTVIPTAVRPAYL